MPAPLVVFSHLRWDFVYQRPQHVLSRLATRRPVFVVEEPVFAEGPPRLERSAPAPGVTVLTPHTPVRAPGFADEQIETIRPLIEALGREEEWAGTALAWLYTPLALPLARPLRPAALVYDCMDELAAFDHAPPALLAREAELLAEAELVFTGGPSLYRAKRGRNPNVHCFPSSVDAAHFGRAREGAPDAPAEPPFQASLPRPRLGFFGVIDERLDLDVVRALASAHPEWQVVLVGPVVKIDPATLPQAPNLHYTGQQAYADLPAFLSGWDVCLLPFARNRSTEFISPTKTLEYMAAERPIVSTPITDVAEPYGEIVYLADTPEAFVKACERALVAPAAERAARTEAMRAVLAQTSWDATASAMHELLDEASGEAPREASTKASRSALALS